MADLIKIIEEENEKYSNLSWNGFFILKSLKATSRPILLRTLLINSVSYEYLFIYDIAKLKLIQHYNCEQIRRSELKDDEGIVIMSIFDSKQRK